MIVCFSSIACSLTDSHNHESWSRTSEEFHALLLKGTIVCAGEGEVIGAKPGTRWDWYHLQYCVRFNHVAATAPHSNFLDSQQHAGREQHAAPTAHAALIGLPGCEMVLQQTKLFQ